MKRPEIENLKAWIFGKSSTGYQRALGMREFEKLLDYIKELEQLQLGGVSGSVSVSWREKLRALMEGLEIEKVDEFILKAKKGDYRKLGETMQKRIKELIHYR